MGRKDLLGLAVNHLHDAGLVPTYPRIVVAKLLLEHGRCRDADESVERAQDEDIFLCHGAVAAVLDCFAGAGLLPMLAGGRPGGA